MIARRSLTIGSLCLALAACGGSGGTAPGAVSEGEAKALEEAAQMLDERRLPEGVVPDLEAQPASGDGDGEETTPEETE